jgi:arylformamidase
MSLDDMAYRFEEAVDLTQELSNGMPIYPGNPVPSFKSYSTIARDGVNITSLSLGSHTGTHIDAPRHFIPTGVGIDRIPPKKLIGEAYVADLSYRPIGSAITSSNLKSKLESSVRTDDIVVCYTGCSELWGDERVNSNFTYLTGGAAEYLVSKKVRAVGIDCLSVERFRAPDPVAHKTLLGNGIFILESLSSALRQFLGKRVLLICLPIKLKGGDAAPSRVIAIPIATE